MEVKRSLFSLPQGHGADNGEFAARCHKPYLSHIELFVIVNTSAAWRLLLFRSLEISVDGSTKEDTGSIILRMNNGECAISPSQGRWGNI